jgi:hypothetical protein
MCLSPGHDRLTPTDDFARLVQICGRLRSRSFCTQAASRISPQRAAGSTALWDRSILVRVCDPKPASQRRGRAQRESREANWWRGRGRSARRSSAMICVRRGRRLRYRTASAGSQQHSTAAAPSCSHVLKSASINASVSGEPRTEPEHPARKPHDHGSNTIPSGAWLN